MSRILVYGAGAIGQWIGARLSLVGEDVTVLCRKANHDAIRDRGIRITLADGTSTTAKATALERIPEDARFDWIFLTVKAFAVDEALHDLVARGLLSREGVHVCGFQNGVGTEEAIAAAAGPERTYITVVLKPIALGDEPGSIVEASEKGGLGLAPFSPTATFGALDLALDRTGLSLKHFADYRVMKWSKLLLNMSANALCAIVDASPADVYADRPLFRIEARAFEEAAQVMRAMKLEPADFPDYPARKLWMLMTMTPRFLARRILHAKVGKARGSKQPSLRLEMESPRPQSEVHWLNGAVVRHGARVGVPAPANEFLERTLSDIVQGRIPWDTYRGRPERLVRDFRVAIGAWKP